MIEKNKIQQQQFFFEVVYLINLIFWLLSYSTVSSLIPNIKYIMLFNAVALIVYTIRGFFVDEKTFWTATMIFCLTVLAYYFSRDKQIFNVGVLLFLSQGIDRDRILKLYVVVVSVVLLALFILSQFGIIQDLLFVRSGVTRHAFGTIQPTFLSAQLFTIGAAITVVTDKEKNYIAIVVLLVLALICYWPLNARNDTLFILLLLIVLFMKKSRFSMKRVQHFVSCVIPFSTIISSVIVFVLAINYTSSRKILVTLNEILTDRIRLSWVALNRYPITLFGQKMIENGNGGGTQIASSNYFFVDSSYVRLLLRYGSILFLVLIIVYTLSIIVAILNGRTLLALVLSIIAVQIMWEQTFLTVGNAFVFYLVIKGNEYASFNDWISNGYRLKSMNIFDEG